METLLEDYKQEIIQFEQKLSNINKQIFDYDKEIQTIQEDEAVSRTRIESLQETKSRNIIDIEEFEEKQTNLSDNNDVLSGDLKILSSEIDKVEENYKVKLVTILRWVDNNNCATTKGKFYKDIIKKGKRL